MCFKTNVTKTRKRPSRPLLNAATEDLDSSAKHYRNKVRGTRTPDLLGKPKRVVH